MFEETLAKTQLQSKQLPKSDFVTYDNTQENAEKIGWLTVPEYCFGDQTASKVTHNHDRGSFYFHE